MNADQLTGKWMQFKGELKQRWGKFRDNYIVQSEGGYEQFAAKTQEWYGDKKMILNRADQCISGRRRKP